MNYNNFNSYTKNEINSIQSSKIKIANNENDIVEFVKRVKNKKNTYKKIYIGKISEEISKIIKDKYEIDIEGYNISINENSILHIINHHSSKNEVLRGQIPIDEKDFKNIPLIINNADYISLGYRTKQNKSSIIFEKNINGNNVVVTYVSNKHHNLELHTMFKFKENEK